jgi:hypothetical protein
MVALCKKIAHWRVKALYQISKAKLNYPMLCKDARYFISCQRPYINKEGSRKNVKVLSPVNLISRQMCCFK